MPWISTPLSLTLPAVFDALAPDAVSMFWCDSADETQASTSRSMLTLELRLRARIEANATHAPWAELDAHVADFRAGEPGCPAGLVAWLSYEAGFIGTPLRCHRASLPSVELYETLAALVVEEGRCALITRGDTLDQARALATTWRQKLAWLPNADARRRDAAIDNDVGALRANAARPSLTVRQIGEQARYEAGIAEIQRAIAEGAIQQACCTYPITFARPARMERVYQALRTTAPAAYCAFVRTPTLECASTSPECFFELEGDRLRSRPMKGTRRRGTRPDHELAEELRANPKDRAENAMIAEMVAEELRTICEPESVAISKLFEVDILANVLQMSSTVEGRVRDSIGPFEVFGALAPPGSMTGEPKAVACALLRDLEEGPRGLYSGSIAWIDGADRASFSVVIRSLQAAGDEAAWHVGGGIVAASHPSSEWDESRAKAATLLESPHIEGSWRAGSELEREDRD